MAIYESNTPLPYKTRLESKLGNIDLKIPPIGLNETKILIGRSLDDGGVFGSAIADKLVFVGDGAKLLRDLYSQDGVNAKCTYKIFWYKNSTATYTELPSSFDLSFEEYGIVKVGQFHFGVSVKADISEVLKKFENRRTQEIDLTSLTSIGNYSIIDFTSLESILRVPIINSYATANFNSASGFVIDYQTPRTLDTTNINSSDFGSQFREIVGNQLPSKGVSCFYESDSDRTMDVTGTITFDCVFTGTTELLFMFYEYDETGSVVQSAVQLASLTTTTGTRIMTIDSSISMTEGYSYALTVSFGSTLSDPSDTATITTSDITLSETLLSSPQTDIETIPVLEGMTRAAQHVLDIQFALYSDKYGRSGIAYNSDGDTYSSESQLSFRNLVTGVGLRGGKLTDNNNPFKISIDTLIRSLKATDNIGVGIELIDGQYKLRAEDYSYFFNDTVILDLSDRIDILDIKTTVISKLCYASYETGFNEYDYEAENGRGEYNTNAKRTSILNTKEVFNNVSPIREDTRAISKTIAASLVENGSTDEKEDNDMFIIKSQRQTGVSGVDWKAETDENITIDNDSSIYKDGSLNLYDTPTRMLVRNSNKWSCGLIEQQASKLLFQTCGKYQTLETTGESYSIKENDNIQIYDSYIDSPIFKALQHTVEVEFTNEDLETLQGSTGGIPNWYMQIRFTDDITGWIYPSIEKQIGENKAIVNIIEKA